MSEKRCTQCGEMVPEEAKFCPYCKSTSFRQAEIERYSPPEQNDLTHRLFYWRYDGGYALSKTKLVAISSFLVFVLSGVFTSFFGGMIIVALFISAMIFLIGFAAHKLISYPSKAQFENSNLGFPIDLVHLIFFWQNKRTGEYVLSKTKAITAIIFMIFALFSLSLNVPSLFAFVLFGAVFAVPAFIIGFAIHKLTNNNPTNKKITTDKKTTKTVTKAEVKKQVEKVETLPEESEYEKRLEEIKSLFYKKEENARDLIEKRFAPPQLTYTRFISVVDKSRSVFDTEAGEISDILNLASEYSPRIEEELESKFEVLKSICDRMEDLINELVLSFDKSNDGEVTGLIDDMEDLIGSIRDYD